jgi:hypothetical protein
MAAIERTADFASTRALSVKDRMTPIRELPPGVNYMPKPWQPLSVLIAAEEALALPRP